MSMLSKVLGLNPEEEAVVDEAEAKKARIAYHRDHVRNGPLQWKTVTAGQQRRAEARRRKTASRKATRRYKRDWMANQRAIAALRGRLIVVSAAPGTYTEAQVHNAEVGLVGALGHERPWLATDAEIREAIQASREHYESVTA